MHKKSLFFILFCLFSTHGHAMLETGPVYWINEGDEVLIGGMHFPNENTPKTLKALNVGAVINLTGYNFFPEKYESREIEQCHIPVSDMTPPTINQIHAFIKKADEYMTKGKNIIVHCAGGKGRTGTMIACWLVAKKGYVSVPAIKWVRIHSKGSVETLEQEEVVKEFYNSLNFIG